ncbi:MAG: hypothetical protein E4H28_05165 [Gemmatimonadales bacterium]|nr:MAG: hypothetical protein E4H28_05165 [Gemmatimonadales bacterium]
MTGREQQVSSVQVQRRDYRSALRIGLVISAVVHFVVIFVLGRALSLDPASFRSPPRRTIELQGLPVVQVDEVQPAFETDPDAVRLPLEEEPEPGEEQQDGETPEGPAALPIPGRALVGPPRLTNAEKLQPQEGDERLWYDLDGQPIPEYLDHDVYAAYEGEIRSRLSRMLDSLSLSDEQRRRALEWITGDEGQEWGVTPDGIYIAGMLIPLSLGQLFAEEGPNGRESRQQAQDLGDIRFQDLLGEAEQIRKERAQEMRDRTKQELERRLQDSLEAAADST